MTQSLKLIEVLRQLAKREAGTDVFIDPDDVEKSEDLGWVEVQPNGKPPLLTDRGRALLAEIAKNRIS